MINKFRQQLDLTLANATIKQSKLDPLLRAEIVNLLTQLINECVFVPVTACDGERSDEQR